MTDINECSITNVCSGQGKCINTYASYDCLCDIGYYGMHCEMC